MPNDQQVIDVESTDFINGDANKDDGVEDFYSQSENETESKNTSGDTSGLEVDTKQTDQKQDDGSGQTKPDEPSVSDVLSKLENLEKKIDSSEDKDDDPGLEDEFVELNAEELDLLYEEDPRAAREYQELLMSKRIEALESKISDIDADKAFHAEMATLNAIEKEFDSSNGEGAFKSIQSQLSDPDYLSKLFTGVPEVGHIIAPMVKAGDRIGVVRVLVREAKNFNASVSSARRSRSISASNGNGTFTQASKSIDSMEDAWDNAKAELEA